ncbi:MAG TPA: hypothetical protein VGP90_08805 [Acidimicrobiia bacterium]|jgi:hypothetical protein|nr:hypothetical protein [Acidimicrobiia bacterium]
MTGDVDFGQDWLEADGRRGRLTWNEYTFDLVYHGHRYGIFAVARVRDVDGLRLLLAGWEDHTAEGIAWVWSRVAHLKPCPCCDGLRWIGRNRDGGERVVPCPLCNRVAV